MDNADHGSAASHCAESKSKAAGKTRIGLLEAGRGVAALLVVIFHSNASSPYFGGPQIDWMRPLEVGVDFFFLLSGYVIMFAHQQDIGKRAAAKRYLSNRALRLFPTLWLIVLGAALAKFAFSGSLDLAQLVRSMLPFPSLLGTQPQVIWTLRHELLFYAVFAVMIFDRRVGIVLVSLWCFGVIAFFVGAVLKDIETSLTAFFLSTYHLNFFFGACLCWWHSRRPIKAGNVLPLIISLVFLLAWLFSREALGLNRLGISDYSSIGATLGVLITGLIGLAIVHGLVCAEPILRTPRWLLALGASSYVLYLAHTPLNSLTQRVVTNAPAWFLEIGGGHLALIVVGVLVSYLLHAYAEKPMLNQLRERTRASSSKQLS